MPGSSGSSSPVEYDEPGPHKWFVLLAGFSIQLTASGIMYCVGIFYVMFKEHLAVSDGTIALISLASSLNMCFTFGIGPVAGSVANVLGNRPVAMVGSVMATAGLILSANVTAVWQLCLTFGLLTGTGIGLSYITSIATVSQYFRKHRPIAMGVAAAGLGAGSIVFPPLIQHFLHKFGWRGAMLMVAGMYLQTLVFSALLTPIPKRESSPWNQKKFNMSQDNKESNGQPLSNRNACKKRLTEWVSKEHMEDWMKEDDSKTEGEIDEKYIGDWEKGDHSKTKVRSCCNIYLLANPVFACFLTQCLLFSIGSSILYVHLGAYAVSLGVSLDSAALLFLMLGIASTIVRVIYGLLAQIKSIGPVRLYILAQFLCGVCVVLYPFGHTYTLLSIGAISIGLFYGSFGSLPPLVTVLLVEADNIGPGYGYCCFACAFGFVSGGPLGSLLYSHTKYYPASFFVGGAIMVLSVIFLIPVYYNKIYLSKANQHNREKELCKTEVGSYIAKPYLHANNGMQEKKDIES